MPCANSVWLACECVAGQDVVAGRHRAYAAGPPRCRTPRCAVRLGRGGGLSGRAGRVAAVDRVLEVAFRRWRTAPIAFGAELRAFRERLRQRRYELVLDAQGLLKSAVVGCWARTDERVGFDAASARERVAALAYRRGISVPQDWHAIDRTRRLFAHALGYEVPDREPAFGLRAPRRRTSRLGNESGNEVVFAHGTTWPTKHWPEAFWAALARTAADQDSFPYCLGPTASGRGQSGSSAVSRVRVSVRGWTWTTSWNCLPTPAAWLAWTADSPISVPRWAGRR